MRDRFVAGVQRTDQEGVVGFRHLAPDDYVVRVAGAKPETVEVLRPQTHLVIVRLGER